MFTNLLFFANLLHDLNIHYSGVDGQKYEVEHPTIYLAGLEPGIIS